MEQLPWELLQHIFKYLTAEDKCSVRQTCRRFASACNKSWFLPFLPYHQLPKALQELYYPRDFYTICDQRNFKGAVVQAKVALQGRTVERCFYSPFEDLLVLVYEQGSEMYHLKIRPFAKTYASPVFITTRKVTNAYFAPYPSTAAVLAVHGGLIHFSEIPKTGEAKFHELSMAPLESEGNVKFIETIFQSPPHIFYLPIGTAGLVKITLCFIHGSPQVITKRILFSKENRRAIYCFFYQSKICLITPTHLVMNFEKVFKFSPSLHFEQGQLKNQAAKVFGAESTVKQVRHVGSHLFFEKENRDGTKKWEMFSMLSHETLLSISIPRSTISLSPRFCTYIEGDAVFHRDVVDGHTKKLDLVIPDFIQSTANHMLCVYNQYVVCLYSLEARQTVERSSDGHFDLFQTNREGLSQLLYLNPSKRIPRI